MSELYRPSQLGDTDGKIVTQDIGQHVLKVCRLFKYPQPGAMF